MRALLALVSVLAVGACKHDAPAPTTPHNEGETVNCGLPPDWDCEALTATVVDDLDGADKPSAVTESRLLAWHSTHDDEAGDDQHALLWLKTPEGFLLAHVTRAPPADWFVAFFTDSPDSYGWDHFAQPPTHAELDTFLDHTNWDFAGDPEYPYTGHGICTDDWQAAFGEPPWRAYP